jgi:hypothetical protein
MRITTVITITVVGVVVAAAVVDGFRGSPTPRSTNQSATTATTATAQETLSVPAPRSDADATAAAIADVHTALSELPRPRGIGGDLVVATTGCRLLVLRLRDGVTRPAGKGCLVLASPDHHFVITGLGATPAGEPVWAAQAPLSVLDRSAATIRIVPGPCSGAPAVNDAGAVATCAGGSPVIVPLRGAPSRRRVAGVAIAWGGGFLFADHGALRSADGHRLRIAAAGTAVGYAATTSAVGVVTSESTVVVVRRRAARWVVVARAVMPGETLAGETFALAPDGGLAFLPVAAGGLLIDTSLTASEGLRAFPETLDTTPYLGPSQTAVAFSPDDRYAAFATVDGVVIARRRPLVARAFIATGAVQSIAWLAAP